MATVLVLCAAVGCGSPGVTGDRRAFTSADSWYSPPNSFDFAPLDKDRYAPVTSALQQEAQATLAEVPAKQVTAEEAARLVGHPLPEGKEYVLLRGVVLFEGTGAFTVSVSGKAVHVHHGCLGRRAAPMTRKAVVAVLSEFPDAVFSSCSMAE